MIPTRPLCIERFERIAYDAALEAQQQRRVQVQNGTQDDTLMLLEHEPVITTGRHAGLQHLRVSAGTLAQQGIALCTTDRGGDVTYHGPGQLVGYPILALQPGEQDLKAYVFSIEEILIRTAADFGVRAERVPKLRGVWVGNDKLAAIGIRVARWVTSHGFALNVTTDLQAFDNIVPCGLHGRGVTSLRALCHEDISMQAVEQRLIAHAEAVWQRAAYAARKTAHLPPPEVASNPKAQHV